MLNSFVRRAAGSANQWDFIAFAAILAILTAIAKTIMAFQRPWPA